ncbi:MAG: hypothetical protein AYK18_07080 [Theionarchaea archaeon DG-70]|nr:MAG: hypothetical protein AYK18_07080 [Theionarchaea archaeon DG-70]
MKFKAILLCVLFVVSSFFCCEAGASSLEWRQYYQEGTQYVIVIYSSELAEIQFLWKPQEAQQGAYQLFSTLSQPNEGNLYKAFWNVSAINDGNYSIMVKSSVGDQLEKNVIVNKSHWEVSPVNLVYQFDEYGAGWVDVKYIGTIEGTVLSTPICIEDLCGTLTFYAQYFKFTKQSPSTFRIEVLPIPDEVLKLIYKELYSNGAKFGTLFYQINDDVLEVRVIFPGFSSYRPGRDQPQSTETPSQEPVEEPVKDEDEDMEEILKELRDIKEQSEETNTEISNLRTEIQQKDQEIMNLRDEIEQQAIEEKREWEEEKQNLIFILGGIIVASIGSAVYILRKQNPPRSPQKYTQFLTGRPYESMTTPGDPRVATIPVPVAEMATRYNIDPERLNQAVNQRMEEDSSLTIQEALHEVINTYRNEGVRASEG